MAVNKVEVGGETVIDLTADTVSENNLLVGATAHNAAGEPITGAVAVAPIDSELSETSENPVQNKVITKALNGMGGSFKVITGTYIGNGKSVSCGSKDDSGVTQEKWDSITIDIGETPVAVIISSDVIVSAVGITSTLLQGHTTWGYSSPTYLPYKIVNNGFIANYDINTANTLYKYIALIQC